MKADHLFNFFIAPSQTMKNGTYMSVENESAVVIANVATGAHVGA